MQHIYRTSTMVLYVICVVVALSFVPQNTTWQPMSAIPEPLLRYFYATETRDTAPTTFRWGAQNATIHYPYSSAGLHTLLLVATAPTSDSVIHVSINEGRQITFTPAAGVFRTYRLLVDAPWQTDTTMVRFVNDAPARQERELAVGLAAVRLIPHTPTNIPNTTVLLLMVYSVIVCTTWRLALRWHAIMLLISVLWLWLLARHIPVSVSAVAGYLIGYAVFLVLTARYTTTTPTLTVATTTPPYRRDIDGLRAVAIIPVVVFHAFPQLLPGGNSGVDVFFVISGFLITQVILTQIANERFRIQDFYARRVRRIFPALTIMLVAVACIGYICLFPDEYRNLGTHIAAGAGFFANLLLMSEINYFDKAAVFKPLLHLWSLGVEEQFYIIWPLLLILNRRQVRPLTITILVASLVAHVWLITNASVASFYLPMTRMWELLAGAWLAYHVLTTPPSAATPPPWRLNALSGIGMALICASLLLGNDSGNLALIRGVLPVLGAVCVIAAGETTWINRHVLGRPTMVWIGLISFPLYLWHWPLLSFAHFFVDAEPALWVRCVLVVVSVAAAWATYRYIEQPLRFGKWTHFPSRYLVAGTAAIGIWGASMIGQGWIAPLNHTMPPITSHIPALTRDVPLCDGVSNDFIVTCAGYIAPAATSEYVVLGDSHASAFIAGYLRDDSLTVLSINGCLPALGVERFLDDSDRPDGCVDMAKLPKLLANLAAQPPKTTRTVIVVGRFAAMTPSANYLSNRHGTFQPSGPRLPANQVDVERIIRTGLGATLTALSRLPNTHIIVMEQIPELSFVPMDCNRIQIWQPARDCFTPRAPIDAEMAQSRAVLHAVRDQFPTVTFVDPTTQWCDTTQCMTVHDGYVLYQDTNHPTPYGASLIWRLIPTP